MTFYGKPCGAGLSCYRKYADNLAFHRETVRGVTQTIIGHFVPRMWATAAELYSSGRRAKRAGFQRPPCTTRPTLATVAHTFSFVAYFKNDIKIQI